MQTIKPMLYPIVTVVALIAFAVGMYSNVPAHKADVAAPNTHAAMLAAI
jgi:hypothetical protein